MNSVVMSAPFFGLRFVRSPLSMVRGIRLFSGVFLHGCSLSAAVGFVCHNKLVEV